MLSMSGYENIKTTIQSFDRGRIFFPDAFTRMESSDTIRSALVRLCENNEIIRLAQGIYYYPVIDTKWGLGIMYPSIDDIAQAIAEKDHCRIAPTGSSALNALGLSTQMQANTVYYTDGSPRTISIGCGRGLLFKRTTDMKRFAYRDKIMQLIVAAMREIGNGKLKDSDRNVVREQLKKVSKDNFYHDIALAPAWVQKELRELNEIYRHTA